MHRHRASLTLGERGSKGVFSPVQTEKIPLTPTSILRAVFLCGSFVDKQEIERERFRFRFRFRFNTSKGNMEFHNRTDDINVHKGCWAIRIGYSACYTTIQCKRYSGMYHIGIVSIFETVHCIGLAHV